MSKRYKFSHHANDSSLQFGFSLEKPEVCSVLWCLLWLRLLLICWSNVTAQFEETVCFVLFILVRVLACGTGGLTECLVQQIPVGGSVYLIRRTVRLRSLSQAPSRFPFIPSASTLASLPLVHLFVSKCKTKWHGRAPSPKCG